MKTRQKQSFAIKAFGNLNIGEFTLISISMFLFTTFFILSLWQKNVQVSGFFSDTKKVLPGWAVWSTYVAYFANVINIINLILTIKKKISNCYWGIASSILLGFITLSQGLIWQTLRYWGISVIGQIITLIVWIKSSNNKKSVEIVGGRWLFFTFTMICMLALTALLTWLETTQQFADIFLKKQPKIWYDALFDALPTASLLASLVLIMRRQNQYWLVCYIMVISTLILWILKLCPINGADPIKTLSNFSSWQMLSETLLNLGFAIMGQIEWKKLGK